MVNLGPFGTFASSLRIIVLLSCTQHHPSHVYVASIKIGITQLPYGTTIATESS